MPYATVTLTDEFDLLRQKRLHLNLPQWSSTRARTRKHVTRARAQILISIVKSTLLSRQTRSMTPICGLVKGCQYWYATSSSQPGDQSSVFYLIDIDWRWDQNIRIDAHYARNIYQNWIKTKNKNWFWTCWIVEHRFPHFTYQSGATRHFPTVFDGFSRISLLFAVHRTFLW